MTPSRRLLVAALALGLSGAVMAGAPSRRRSTVGRIFASGVDVHRLAAIERAPSVLARRVVQATYGAQTPTRLGRGGGRPRANALHRR